jgi:hypothetical protein
LVLCFGENRSRYFRFTKARRKFNNVDSLNAIATPPKPIRLNPKRTDSSDEPLQGAEI